MLAIVTGCLPRSAVTLLKVHVNPIPFFFQYGRLQQFVAIREAKPSVELLSAVRLDWSTEEGKKYRYFWLFLSVLKTLRCQALLSAASQWLKRQGMTEVRGRRSFNSQQLPISSRRLRFAPMVMMPYNPAYPKFLRAKTAGTKRKMPTLMTFRLINHLSRI
jgi:hypothetical protein